MMDRDPARASSHAYPPARAHHRAAALLALGLIPPAIWLGARLVPGGAGAREPVYSLAALDGRLAQNPAAWLHRPLRVRALVGGECTALTGLNSPVCGAWALALTDPMPAGGAAPLLLGWDAPRPALTLLRRLPLLGQVLLGPQILHASVPAVYWIELQPAACVPPAAPPCYVALLLDAAPPNGAAGTARQGSRGLMRPAP